MGEVERPEDVPSLNNKDNDSPVSGNVPSTEPKPQPASYWWHVNKSGFPISEETWSKMWQHINDVHPEASRISASIRGQGQSIVPGASEPVGRAELHE